MVPLKGLANGAPAGAAGVVGAEIHRFVLDVAPQALDEHVVTPSAVATSDSRMLRPSTASVKAPAVKWLPLSATG